MNGEQPLSTYIFMLARYFSSNGLGQIVVNKDDSNLSSFFKSHMNMFSRYLVGVITSNQNFPVCILENLQMVMNESKDEDQFQKNNNKSCQTLDIKISKTFKEQQRLQGRQLNHYNRAFAMQSWNSELRSQHLCEKCWLWICTSQNLRVGDEEISSMFNERLCLKVTRQRTIRGVTWHPYLPFSYRNRYFCPHTLAHIHRINLHTPLQKMVVKQTCRPNQGQSVQ